MEVQAALGEKISINETKALANGDFLLTGNARNLAGHLEGFIVRMDNFGFIKNQQRLRVDGQSVRLSNAKNLQNGQIIINGLVEDGTNRTFVSLLRKDLSTVWTQLFTLPSMPSKLTLDSYDTTSVLFAVQLQSDVVYAALTNTGSVRWMRQVAVNGLDELVGFSVMNFSSFALVCNVTRNGKKTVEIADIPTQTGAFTIPHTLTDGTEEAKCLGITGFNYRLYVLSVVKSASGQYRLERTVHYQPSSATTVHRFYLPTQIDFNVTGALDNAADVVAALVPQSGHLFYLRQFPDALMTPDYRKQYNVPLGSALQSVGRSFDGGYLFGMQTVDSGKVVLIKTDSTGQLPGCGSSDPLVTYEEILNQHKFASSGTSTPFFAVNIGSMATTIGANFTSQFLCNQRYCPPPPVEDTCLSSYFKVYRSNSHANTFGKYELMRNDFHLIASYRSDRIMGTTTTTENGINLYNEKGQFIKGITFWEDSLRAIMAFNKVTDSTAIVTSYKTIGGVPAYTYVLVNDQLQVLWSKTVLTSPAFSFTAGLGQIFGDVHRDQEGNYYMTGTNPGYLQTTPKLMVYKMDANGNSVWLKAYEMPGAGNFGNVKLVTTATSVIAIIEGTPTSTTVRLDKANGSFINAYRYNNSSSSTLYTRFAKYDRGQIFYAGSSTSSRLLMGSIDTTGRPVKLRHITNPSGFRAAEALNGMMYASYSYYTGLSTREVLLKVDTSLKIQFFHEFSPLPSAVISGMGVSNTTGSIYVAGNYSYGGLNTPYLDPVLKKYKPSGELGTCALQSYMPAMTEVDPQAVLHTSVSPLQLTFQTLPATITIQQDTAGQMVSAILCSSAPQCSSIRLSAPTKVCSLNSDILVKSSTNQGCTVKPEWHVDTAFAIIKSIRDTGVVLQFKQAGSVWVKAKLNTGCNAYFDSVLIEVSAAPDTLNLGPDKSLCPGNAITLNARKGYVSYQWQDGSTDSTFTVTQPGLYNVSVTDACGGIFKDSVFISAATPIPFDIGPDRTKCNNDTLHLSAPSGFLNYMWNNNYNISSTTSQTVVINPSVDTAYYIKAEKEPGCFAYDTVRIKVNTSPPIDLGADQRFCSGDSAVFTAGTGFQSYLWSNGETSQQIVGKTKGLYSIIGTTAEGCKSFDTVSILDVYDLPVVNLDKNPSLCFGSQKTLSAGSFATYSWSTGATSPSIIVSDTGRYKVEVMDNNGCRGSDSTEITTIHPLPMGFLPLDTAICSYGTIELKPTSNYNRYLWSTGGQQSLLRIERPGAYWLEVTDRNGCKGRDTVVVSTKNCLTGFYAPSAFTPNGDRRNDDFKPLLFGVVKKYHLTIYNRWGQVVFSTTEQMKGWDGKVGGTPQRSDVFVWTCTYQFEGENEKTEKGTVMVVR